MFFSPGYRLLATGYRLSAALAAAVSLFSMQKRNSHTLARPVQYISSAYRPLADGAAGIQDGWVWEGPARPVYQ